MGQPLAIALGPLGADDGAVDVAVVGVEAATPLPAVLGRLPVQRELVDVGLAEAGGADRGAVATGQAAIVQALPVRVGDGRLQHLRQRALGQAACLLAGGPLEAGLHLLELVMGGQGRLQGVEDRLALLGMGLHHEAVVELGEGQVVAVLDPRAVAGGGAEAGGRRAQAVHGDQEEVPASLPVVRVGMGVVQEVAVVDRQGREVAGAHADHRRRLGLGGALAKHQSAVGLALALPQGLPGREGQRLDRLGARGPVEEASRLGAFEPVVAGGLVVDDPPGKMIH